MSSCKTFEVIYRLCFLQKCRSNTGWLRAIGASIQISRKRLIRWRTTSIIVINNCHHDDCDRNVEPNWICWGSARGTLRDWKLHHGRFMLLVSSGCDTVGHSCGHTSNAGRRTRGVLESYSASRQPPAPANRKHTDGTFRRGRSRRNLVDWLIMYGLWLCQLPLSFKPIIKFSGMKLFYLLFIFFCSLFNITCSIFFRYLKYWKTGWQKSSLWLDNGLVKMFEWLNAMHIQKARTKIYEPANNEYPEGGERLAYSLRDFSVISECLLLTW